MDGGVAAPGWGELVSLVVREVARAVQHWPYVLPLVIVLLGMGGWIGRGLGVPNLFRDDDQIFDPGNAWNPDWAPATSRGGPARLLSSPAFWSGAGFMAAFGLFWMVTHADAPDCLPATCPTALTFDPARPHGAGFYPLLAALGVAAVALLAANLFQLRRRRADFQRLRPGRAAAEFARLTAGAALGIGYTVIGYFLPVLMAEAGAGTGWPVTHAYLLPCAAFVAFVAAPSKALPCTSIFSLAMSLMLIGGTYPPMLSPWTGVLVLAGLAAVAGLNGWPGKYSIPGFAPATPGVRTNPQQVAPVPSAGPEAAPLIAPVEALSAWRARRAPRPILVLVATSGGAYRAAFWTSLLLDRLVAGSRPGGPWAGLADSIRLLTGASGGMVASAYFLAMAADGALDQGITRRISTDTWESLRRAGRSRPVARDSLSPVVHRMVRRDLPLTLAPWRQRQDRGRTLEEQWPVLDRSFASFHGQEACGAVPSIVLAPMLVETGAVALFSNLDLQAIRIANVPAPRKPGDENKVSVEVFREFAAAHSSAKLATAVRLNASFPYVSPAISLPTWPERRPVDAGYFDNYGINLLAAYLRDAAVHRWVVENCAGVAIIQIRAFPSEVPTPPATALARALQFASGPPEGLFSARKASQMFRNDQDLVELVQGYADSAGPGFLEVFTFEANTDVSMSWYQRCEEMRVLEGLLRQPHRNEMTFEGPVLLPDDQAGPEVDRLAIRAWAERTFGSWDKVMEALQKDDNRALRAQYLHHRAKVAEEFAALTAFWRDRSTRVEVPDRRPIRAPVPVA